MVKHTQTIRGQQPANCLSVFVHFVGLALKGLISLTMGRFDPSTYFINPFSVNVSLSIPPENTKSGCY